ncbi:ABC transporter ATP-binding protein [Pseudoroseicyclus aestuarii]|uniref:Iron complex transport system ATP-binding protein n=1 Tax=Pseudoroseicyclus aestuarii TaxID=1795041 RepID=A0A318SMP1_9RHOB|nr:ABC transporter ATP-binding protein [Pseudoroseicyclus aestuarii]PYE81320.1 iron complex transport system ATP-binding protein [Pseudoroseicyclus aestuarii]
MAEGLFAGYDGRQVLHGVDLTVETGAVTAIIGANACGKSTLLKTMARLIMPQAGRVLLDGESIHTRSTRSVARVLGLLPQSPLAPEGITVADLVARGRRPHQGFLSRQSVRDDAAVATALEATGTLDLAERSVDALSGGQRQRVWIAMALAQETELLLLDEPTTFLDVAHQIEVLDLLMDMNASRGITVVMVLHDLNLAARYADRLVAMKAGHIYAEGPPGAVFTAPMLQAVFGLRCEVIIDPTSGRPMMLPKGRHRMSERAG